MLQYAFTQTGDHLAQHLRQLLVTFDHRRTQMISNTRQLLTGLANIGLTFGQPFRLTSGKPLLPSLLLTLLAAFFQPLLQALLVTLFLSLLTTFHQTLLQACVVGIAADIFQLFGSRHRKGFRRLLLLNFLLKRLLFSLFFFDQPSGFFRPEWQPPGFHILFVFNFLR